MGKGGSAPSPPQPTQPPPAPVMPQVPMLIMPPMPEMPEMPQPTPVQPVDWQAKREELRTKAAKEWQDRLGRMKGRASTVLTGPEEWDTEPATTSTILAGKRRKS